MLETRDAAAKTGPTLRVGLSGDAVPGLQSENTKAATRMRQGGEEHSRQEDWHVQRPAEEALDGWSSE